MKPDYEAFCNPTGIELWTIENKEPRISWWRKMISWKRCSWTISLWGWIRDLGTSEGWLGSSWIDWMDGYESLDWRIKGGLSKENLPSLDKPSTMRNGEKSRLHYELGLLIRQWSIITILNNFSTKYRQTGYFSQLLNNIVPPMKGIGRGLSK